MPLSQAFELLDIAMSQGNHEFWPDGISLTEKNLFERKRLIGPKQLTDIYLLGLAVSNNGRLVTFDHAVSQESVRGAGAQHLVILS